MSERRSSQFELPEGKGVSARDIAAVWPCSSLLAPVPVPSADFGPGPAAKALDGAESRAPFDDNRSGLRRRRNILTALAAIWKNGLL